MNFKTKFLVYKAKVKNTNHIQTTIVLLLLLLIASCAAKKEAVQIKDKSTSDILEKVELFENAIRSLKGFAKVKIRTPENKISYSQVTVAQRPDLLRLEALNPFGKAVGFISSDGTNIYIISPSERGVYDTNTEFDLAYVYPGLNLKISAENLVNLVLGRLPENIYDLNTSPEISGDQGKIKLSFKSRYSNEPNLLWVNDQNFRVEKAQFWLDTNSRAEIKYVYFDDLINGFYFPKTIDFSSEGLSISIIYDSDIELNTNVDKSLFKPALETANFD